MLADHDDEREGLMSNAHRQLATTTGAGSRLLARGAAVLTVLAALALAGCGGGGGSGSSSSGADYYKQVTKIGNQLATKLESVQSGVSTATTKSAALKGFGQLAAAFDTAASGLSALHAPSEVGSLQAKAVSELHQAVSTLRADASQGDLNKASDDYSRLGEAAKNAILDITIKGP